MNHDLKTTIDHVLRLARARADAFAADLKEAPPTKPCPAHPDIMAALDVVGSQEIGRLRYNCKICQLEADVKVIWEQQELRGMPFNLRQATFENFDYHMTPDAPGSCKPQDFLRAGTALAAGEFQTLILAGTPGIGKGHIAASVINAALTQKRVAPWNSRTWAWMPLHRFFHRVHELYGKNPGPEAFVEGLARKALLVLDEVGMEAVPRDGHKWLYELVEQRLQGRGFNILLSGLAGGPLRDYLGPTISDRLKDGGHRFLWGSWPSHRGSVIQQSPNQF